MAVSPWYFVAWNMFLTIRSSFQEKDLCFLSLSRGCYRVSSVCRLDPIGLEPLFVKVCFRRCHCAPSMFNGPDGKSMVAIPCVVVAMVGPMI